jgi:hypothetical protein
MTPAIILLPLSHFLQIHFGRRWCAAQEASGHMHDACNQPDVGVTLVACHAGLQGLVSSIMLI